MHYLRIAQKNPGLDPFVQGALMWQNRLPAQEEGSIINITINRIYPSIVKKQTVKD